MEPQQPGKDPLFHEPFQQPMQPPAAVVMPSSPEPADSPPPRSRLLLIIGALSVIELLVIIGLAIAVISNSDSNPASTSKSNGSDTSQTLGPTAATSSSVQLTDDSITQDLSSLNDDKDFPADKFTDKSLNL